MTSHDGVPADFEVVGGDPSTLRRDLWEAEQRVKEQDAEIERLHATTAELARLLNGVSEFIASKQSVDEHVAAAAAEFNAQLEAVREQARDERMTLMEQRTALRALEEELRERHERDVSTRAMQLLDQRTKEVNDQNFDLVRDKLLLANDLENYRSRCAELESENTTLRQRADLAGSGEAEHLQRSVKQKREIAELKRHTKTLEDNMQAVVQQYEDRLAKQAKAHDKVVSQLTRERDDARVDAEKLLREVKRLRMLSNKILSERSELENYFHDALREVRQEIVAERRKMIADSSTPYSNVAGYTQNNASALRLESQKRLLLTAGTGNNAAPNDNAASSRWGRDSKGMPVLKTSANGKKKQKGLPPIPVPRPAAASAGSEASSDSRALVCSTTSSQPQYTRLNFHNRPPSNEGGVADESDDAYYGAGARLSSSANADEAGRDDGFGGVEGSEVPQLLDGPGSRPLRTIPDAPTLKDIQKVDIGDLSWTDKERVLRLLFKRLQRESHNKAAAMQRRPVASEDLSTEATSALSDEPQRVLRDDDNDTFLTQQ